MKNLNYPLVSVIMICYNQEKYIAKAVEGVLAQQYDGEIELIIANDRSLDGTEKIISDIINNHKNSSWIKHTNHENNKGMFENIKWALNEGKGKYIALCEGDDYWIDPLKISKQVDFLEKNSDYSMCFHNAETINYSKEYNKEFANIESREYIIDEAYNSWIIPTASIVFKSVIVKDFLSHINFQRVFNWDIILILNCFKHGKVRGMEDFMSIYRFGEDGLSILRMKKGKIEYQENNLIHHRFIKESFKNIDKDIFKIKFFHIHMELFQLYYQEHNPKFIKHFAMALYNRPYLPTDSLLKLLKLKK